MKAIPNFGPNGLKNHTLGGELAYIAYIRESPLGL